MSIKNKYFFFKNQILKFNKLYKNSLDPIIYHQVMDRKLTCINFSKTYPIVLISDDGGNVNIYKLKNFNFFSNKSFNEQVNILQNIIVNRNEIFSIQNNNNNNNNNNNQYSNDEAKTTEDTNNTEDKTEVKEDVNTNNTEDKTTENNTENTENYVATEN